jgi:hypothetical protein
MDMKMWWNVLTKTTGNPLKGGPLAERNEHLLTLKANK